MIHCLKCNKHFHGDPWVVKPGELYRCVCLICRHTWLIDANGEWIPEGEDNAGTHADTVDG